MYPKSEHRNEGLQLTGLDRLAEKLPEQVDAGLIISPINRRYYTGFLSSAGVLVVIPKKSCFFIDFRYYEHAKAQITDCEVILADRLTEQMDTLFRENQIKTVAVEAEHMTLSEFRDYQKMFPDIRFLDSDDFQKVILSDRIVKSEQEIQSVIDAQRIAEKAFEETLNYIKKGRTEREIALFLDYTMKKLGAEDISFETIIASGKNSAVPHAVPTDKPVENGDFIVMDFGAVVNGYHSDMTRTVAVGGISSEQERVYDTVLKAQLAAIQAVKKSMSCNSIDAAARQLIDNSGYAGCFGHSTGHGVGLEIHEKPNISPKNEQITENNMLFTIEPGIYLEGKFGVRIEDMMVVRDNGCLNLTKSKKERISL